MDVQTQTLRVRRRPSPASVKSSDTRSKKRSANDVHTQAASPAVISNLIDSLSAISVPAHDHFENLLVGYNDSLSASVNTSIHTASGRNSIAGHDGSSVDHSAYNNSIREQNDAFPDDACEPPVIRTSKPPSGFSALTAPKKKDKPHSLSSYIGRSSGSSASLHSTHSNQSVTSFGNISIEAGVPNKPSGGSERSSAESKRSAKGHRSLMYMSSRERLRLKETERKRHTTHSLEDIASHDSPRKNSAPLFSYEDTIKEEPTSREENRPFQGESSRFAQRYPDRSASPRRLRINLVDGPNGESPSDQGLIPERGSSLRHTGSPPRRSRKNRTSGTSRKQQTKTETVPEESVKMDEESAMKEKILQELEQEENEVAQRIRVLKEQKLRREILAGKQPMDADAGATPPSVPHVSVIPSPESSPSSTVSSVSERRVQSSIKAHKVLGITRGPSPMERPVEKPTDKAVIPESEPERMAIPQTRNLRHSRRRSWTVNDGDDLTPLPINYALAVQSLEEASPPSPTFDARRDRSPPPPSISVTSSRETKSSVTSPKRSSSVAVGGRSAVGRKATSSALMGNPKGHKHSSSVTDGIGNTKPASFRSASEEIGPRHQSMVMPSSASTASASNSLLLQRRRTLTKKRWSHPDLPAKAEKAHNDKVDRREAAAAGAVQKPPHPVIEERPASLDSIDLEVDGYLNSTRLSQKIRHPQTGRIISFSEVGDPNGFAVFVCVGMGLTRYVMAFYDQLAATLKLRLITPDRPGIGGSQVDPNGTPLSWPGESSCALNVCSLLTHRRRCTRDLPGSEDHKVLHVSAFGRSSVRTGNITKNASAYSWTCPSACTLDPTLSDGTDRHQSGLTTHPTASSIATLFARPSSVPSKSRELNLSKCNKRQPSANRPEELSKDTAKKHDPAASGHAGSAAIAKGSSSRVDVADGSSAAQCKLIDTLCNKPLRSELCKATAHAG